MSENHDVAVTREELHFRRLDYRGFKRSDGLFEVEAHLIDRRTYDFQPPSGERVIAAGTPIHDHAIRVVLGSDMVIREIHATMYAFPYGDCPTGSGSLQAMVGARIGRGWSEEIRRRLPAASNCTHLKEMLVPLATAAFQTLSFLMLDRIDAVDERGKPIKIDTCAGYAASGELVRMRWPEHHQPQQGRPDKLPG